MNILIAPDKFKGSLTAEEVCDAVARGILQKFPDAHIVNVPLADGGDGTASVLTKYFQGSMHSVEVTGPLFDKVIAQYGTDKEGKAAFIEMASASGLELLVKTKRNPLCTTTKGTGELIRHALDHGAKKIILGIGGSSTNDAGIGMAEALGYSFLDRHQRKLLPTGENLQHLHNIQHDGSTLLNDVELIALCDVDNPLYGPDGAAHIYGPQKGADEQIISVLDEGLKTFADVVYKTMGKEANFPGAGAGGGISSGAKVFLNATLRKGIDFITEMVALEEKIKLADLIITGEGKIDAQSLSGKVIGSVARLSSLYSKKVVAVCGTCELRKSEWQKMGIADVLTLTDPFTSQEDAIRNAAALISKRIVENSL